MRASAANTVPQPPARVASGTRTANRSQSSGCQGLDTHAGDAACRAHQLRWPSTRAGRHGAPVEPRPAGVPVADAHRPGGLRQDARRPAGGRASGTPIRRWCALRRAGADRRSQAGCGHHCANDRRPRRRRAGRPGQPQELPARPPRAAPVGQLRAGAGCGPGHPRAVGRLSAAARDRDQPRRVASFGRAGAWRSIRSSCPRPSVGRPARRGHRWRGPSASRCSCLSNAPRR